MFDELLSGSDGGVPRTGRASTPADTAAPGAEFDENMFGYGTGAVVL